MSAAAEKKTERVVSRVTLENRRTLEQAAAWSGASLNQFIVQAALHEAERVIEKEQIIQLSLRDTADFMAALDNPPAPNERLLGALKVYQQDVISE